MLKGGLETRLFNYMNYFLERGDDVSIVVSKISEDVAVPQVVKVIQIDLSLVPKPLRHLAFNSKLPGVLKKNSFDFILSLERTSAQDLLIAPNTHIGYLKAKNKKWYSPSDWIQLYLDRVSFRNAKCIFACSNMIRNEILSEYKIASDKVKLLYPPINIDKFKRSGQTQEMLRKQLNLPLDKRLFLFVSASHKRKGLQLLLKVFRSLKDGNAILVIAGAAYECDDENILSMGFIEQMHNLYEAADFTVHPAIYEPFGQIVSESLACGTPVIISDRVGAAEVVDDQCGIIIDNLDWTSWRDTIQNALPEKFEVPDHFASDYHLDLSSHMDQIISAYKQLKDRGE